MGAPPNEDAMAAMMEDPNMQQMLNEALNNPAMIEMMIQQTPGLQDNAQTREMLRSPEFREMLTNPAAIRQAAAMGRMMRGGGGANAFPAPGVTDNTEGGAAGTPNANQAPPANPFAMFGNQPGAANPFAGLFPAPGQGATPTQTPPALGSAGGAGSPPAGNPDPANPFASLFGGAGAGAGGNNAAAGGNPFNIPGMPPMTPEMMRQAMQMMGGGAGGNGNLPDFASLFGGAGAGNPPAPADTRPPEERYADQLRQLNDMGFFDFDRNVEALRRSGGSVQGAIEQLLS